LTGLFSGNAPSASCGMLGFFGFFGRSKWVHAGVFEVRLAAGVKFVNEKAL